MNTLPFMHYTDGYLLQATNPVTVNLIGTGGTGSQMLTALGRMNHTLLALGHPGLQVTAFDPDVITEANLGRQLFAESELGLNKSVALVNRMNRFFGTNWIAKAEPFGRNAKDRLPDNAEANIYVSCVDSAKARFEIAEILEVIGGRRNYGRDKAMYWLDCGNARSSGQAILATLNDIKQPRSALYTPVGHLQKVTTEFKDLLESQDDSNEPSCSLAEALEKQDLFINTIIAGLGASLLFRLFRHGMTEDRGVFHNMDTCISQPLKVAA